MSDLLDPVEDDLQRVDELTVPVLGQQVVVVVPDVGGGAAHQPRLAQLHAEGQAAQERRSRRLGQVADPVAGNTRKMEGNVLFNDALNAFY